MDIRDGGRLYFFGCEPTGHGTVEVLHAQACDGRQCVELAVSRVLARLLCINDLLNASINEPNSGVRRWGGNKIIHTSYDHDMLRASGVY